MEVEEPAAGLAAPGADGDEVEELAVFVLRAVDGQQALQGLPVQMVVLHAWVSFQTLCR
jgi:hypothetical protein